MGDPRNKGQNMWMDANTPFAKEMHKKEVEKAKRELDTCNHFVVFSFKGDIGAVNSSMGGMKTLVHFMMMVERFVKDSFQTVREVCCSDKEGQ